MAGTLSFRRHAAHRWCPQGAPAKLHLQALVCLQEDDVIGVLSSKDISQLQPLGDRILIQARAELYLTSHPPWNRIQELVGHV